MTIRPPEWPETNPALIAEARAQENAKTLTHIRWSALRRQLVNPPARQPSPLVEAVREAVAGNA